jgi:hypothetical protein
VGPRPSKGMHGRLVSESNLTPSILVLLCWAPDCRKSRVWLTEVSNPGNQGHPLLPCVPIRPGPLRRSFGVGRRSSVRAIRSRQVAGPQVSGDVMQSNAKSSAAKVGDQCRLTGLSAQSGGI